MNEKEIEKEIEENRGRTIRCTDEEWDEIKATLKRIKEKTGKKQPQAIIAAIRFYEKKINELL